MENNLHAASSQWANRPADQRFWTLSDLHAATHRAFQGSRTARLPATGLDVEATEHGTIRLVGKATGQRANLTHWAFQDLCGAVHAPPAYLRSLPAPVAVDALKAGLAKHAPSTSARDILFHQNGHLTARAILSEKYSRVWDHEVVSQLLKLGAEGWRAPAGLKPWGEHAEGIPSRPATEADILPGQINVRPGDMIAPSGLYASDHDMFAFLVAPDRVVQGANGHALMRGLFVKNSEVGDASLTFTFFLMQTVCGNHIVWNAQGVHDIRIRHVGDKPLARALTGFEATLRRYHDAAPEEEARILAARNLVLGSNKQEVLESVIKYARSHSIPLSQRAVGEAYDVAEKHEDWYGNPRSLWGVVSGLTHASQNTGFADDRTEADRAAGRLMQMAF